VQALLLEEGVTVTDLDMEDPLALDSDVSAVYPPLIIDHDVNQRQALSCGHTGPAPAQTTHGIPVLPVQGLLIESAPPLGGRLRH
jgi:hypothetical protein